jgi:hypothetical protein
MTIRPLVLVCIVVFAVAMLGVRFIAHGIVDNFGTIGALAAIGAMIGAAHVYDNHHRERP